jgi:hypothetical protein
MSRVFKIEPFWHDEYYKIYNKDSVEIKPGITNLLSCNGGGKTTLLEQIKHQICKDDSVILLKYSEVSEGRSNAMGKYGFLNQFDKLSRNFMSSEGENVLNNFGEFCNKLGHKVKNLDTSKKEVWILLDGIDSGLSVNEIADIPDFLKMVCDDIQEKGLTPYVLIAGNNYELIGKFKDNCLDAINLEYLTVNSYEEYRKIIFKSGELKRIRYEEGTKRIEEENEDE